MVGWLGGACTALHCTHLTQGTLVFFHSFTSVFFLSLMMHVDSSWKIPHASRVTALSMCHNLLLNSDDSVSGWVRATDERWKTTTRGSDAAVDAEDVLASWCLSVSCSCAVVCTQCACVGHRAGASPNTMTTLKLSHCRAERLARFSIVGKTSLQRLQKWVEHDPWR